MPAARSLAAEKGPVLIYREGKRLGGMALRNDRAGERKNKLEELTRLRHAALAELERRGYQVRGKTPAQIREMLKRRPRKSRQH